MTTCSVAARESIGCELAAEVIRSFGKLRFRATGASMLPIVRPGDTLLVKRDDSAATMPGEVILFRRQGRLVAHRVVSRTLVRSTLQWITCGDSVAGNDAPVSSDELLGRVAAVERGAKQFIPRQSVASRLVAWVLRRSDLCTRLVLRFGTPGFGIRVWRFGCP